MSDQLKSAFEIALRSLRRNRGRPGRRARRRGGNRRRRPAARAGVPRGGKPRDVNPFAAVAAAGRIAYIRARDARERLAMSSTGLRYVAYAALLGLYAYAGFGWGL